MLSEICGLNISPNDTYLSRQFFLRVADGIHAFTQTYVCVCVCMRACVRACGPIHDTAKRSLGESAKILSKCNICNKFYVDCEIKFLTNLMFSNCINTVKLLQPWDLIHSSRFTTSIQLLYLQAYWY